MKILSLDPDFILKAEEKFKFTALSLLLIELEKDPAYIVKIPIFFDATCSGIQHLAGLMRDEELSREVNLGEQSEEDPVTDIYSKLANPINEEIRRIGLEEIKYINLKEVKLPRNVLKRPIMTKTYSVTIYGIFEQLIEHFPTKKCVIGNKNVTYYLVPSIYKGINC